MLDLRTDAVTDWLRLVRPVDTAHDWPPAVRPVEASPRAEILLVDLGNSLEREAQHDATLLSSMLRHPDLTADLQALLAQLGAARPLRILHWLSERDIPNALAIILAVVSGDTEAARALNATIATVTRRGTLNRLFAPERLVELQIAAEAAFKEPI